jgi:copper chaperone CopZ
LISKSIRQPRFQVIQIQFKEKNMSTVTFSVPGMTCESCVRTIQTEVRRLDGVRFVIANAVPKQVVVTFDAPASKDQIKALLGEINYPAAG